VVSAEVVFTGFQFWVMSWSTDVTLLLFAQKLALVRNQSFFASSEPGTCSDRISTRNCSFTIIFVYLEFTRWYLSHNVIYVLKKLGIMFSYKGALIWDWAGSGAFSWSKFHLIKLDISVWCYFTVHRARTIAEIGSFLPENEETQYRLHHTATASLHTYFHTSCSMRHSFNPFIIFFPT
jgi:hypothetical protein